MDNIFLLILIGFIIAGFGTLIGAGGGFILVPLLLLSHPGLSPDIVTAISIAVVAVNAVSGSLAYAKTKRIDYKAGFLFALFTIPGSVLGVYLVNYIPRHAFSIIFGGLLILLAFYLLIKSKKPLREKSAYATSENCTEHTLVDAGGNIYSYCFNKTTGIIVSILVGFLSPMLGIGGGIIHVPAMVQWLHFPVHIVTATSHFILAIMSVISVVTHIFEGSYNDPSVQKLLLGLCIGVIPGAQFGAYLSQKLKTNLIIRILAICLAIVGMRILL